MAVMSSPPPPPPAQVSRLPRVTAGTRSARFPKAGNCCRLVVTGRKGTVKQCVPEEGLAPSLEDFLGAENRFQGGS